MRVIAHPHMVIDKITLAWSAVSASTHTSEPRVWNLPPAITVRARYTVGKLCPSIYRSLVQNNPKQTNGALINFCSDFITAVSKFLSSADR